MNAHAVPIQEAAALQAPTRLARAVCLRMRRERDESRDARPSGSRWPDARAAALDWTAYRLAPRT